MKNILIATDFSKEAYCALYYATQLFKDESSRFFISNFYGDEIHTSVYSIVNEEEFTKAAQHQRYSRSHCTETLHQIIRDTDLDENRFEIISSDRKLISGIGHFISEKEIDLVVMGTKKHRGTLESIYGTHTTKLINKALPCPILVIPRELDYKPPQNIAFGSDLQKPVKVESIKFLKLLVEKFNAQITVVYDGEETQLTKKQWTNFNDFKSMFNNSQVQLMCTYTHIEISRTIAEFVKTHQIDMLSMIYYKHSLADNIFREPVVENIDKHLSFPFLILPEG